MRSKRLSKRQDKEWDQRRCSVIIRNKERRMGIRGGGWEKGEQDEEGKHC